jgi:hypothetical protein
VPFENSMPLPGPSAADFESGPAAARHPMPAEEDLGSGLIAPWNRTFPTAWSWDRRPGSWEGGTPRFGPCREGLGVLT